MKAPTPSEEFRRFESLTRKLVAVPKAEIDAALKKEKQRKARAKKPRRSAAASR
jgi:hypothetical protein